MTKPALIRLARFVAEDPMTPDEATLTILRQGVIDTLGCIHAGVGTEVAAKARQAVRAMGALGDTPVIGTDMTTSRPQAAFLNAVAGHTLDFDDWEIPGNTHPTVVLVPALLAVADDKTDGMALACAYLVGFEVIARLGEAMNFAHYDAGWHSTATLGATGAAAACARLLGLNTLETANALSFAISATSGYTCQFGSNAKPVQAGFAARAGVEAVFLAKAGMTAQAHVLDHPRGQAALMGGLDPDRFDAALTKLGRGYALTEYGLVLKPWPSCGYTHRIMTCALAMRDHVQPGEIARMDLHLPDFHAAILPFVQPADRNEALFSLPFVAAMGFLRGGLTLADLNAGVWSDPEVASLIGKVRVYPFKPARPDQNYSENDPDRLIVTFFDGTKIERTCDYPLGAPQSPMSEAQLLAKFEANTGSATEEQTGKTVWVARLRNWPQEQSIRTLMMRQG